MTKGVVFYAKNNGFFDYIAQAEVAALLVKHFMDVPVALICDKSETPDTDRFDEIINIDFDAGNIRRYEDGKHHDYFNINRLDVFDITPFDETLVLDTDYLVQNRALDSIWGCSETMLMNSKARQATQWPEGLLNTVLGIGYPNMYWFTACYFKKHNPFVKEFYELAKEVQQNYKYYASVYGVGSKLVRNDYIMTITAHIIGGAAHNFIKPLPVQQINSWEDEIIALDYEKIVLNNPNDPWPVVLHGQNLHLIQKQQIKQYQSRFEELYG
jgi:hypothetical protein